MADDPGHEEEEQPTAAETTGEPTEQPTYTEPGPGVPWRLALFLILAIVVVVFAVQNTQAVELHFLGWNWDLPLVIIILMAVVVTIILDQILTGLVTRRRRRRRIEKQELRRLRGES